MSYQPFLIADYRDGIDKSLSPWISPAQAFQEVEDAYIHHGVIRKRNGKELFGTAGATQVTGIYNFVTNTGERDTIVTNTTSLYRYNPLTLTFDLVDSPFNSSNYMWFANFGVTGSVTQNTLYMTNFADNMRSYVTGAIATTAFIPQYGSSAVNDRVATSLMVFTFRNRLLLLHTMEGSATVGSASVRPQRARWSQANNPNIWRDDIPGQGGFVDAPTGDFIISARFLKDVLIVFFSNSTWSLQPTSDPALPFRWVKINNFRACDATFATISHDDYVISFGKMGIIGCDGLKTPRIDHKIEDFTSDIVDAENFNLMYSDRNYEARRSWTLYPTDDDSGKNTQALIRSEETGAWSIYNIEMACLGQGEAEVDFTFADFTGSLDKMFIQMSDNETWDSFYFQTKGNLFLGGDYEGNIYSLEQGLDDEGDPIGFRIKGASWNPYKEKGIEAQLGYVDIYAEVDPHTKLTIKFYLDDDINPYAQQEMNLIPEEGYWADIQSITLANPAVVTAPQNGLSTGQQVYLSGVNGMEEINGGPYTITVIDDNSFSLDDIDSSAFTAYTSGGVVTEYDPEDFDRVWKRVFAGGIGYNHTVEIETSGINQVVAIHSITPWFRPAGTRMIR